MEKALALGSLLHTISMVLSEDGLPTTWLVLRTPPGSRRAGAPPLHLTKKTATRAAKAKTARAPNAAFVERANRP